MKKAVLLILICLMTSVLHAQGADAHIASLVNNEEWFALAEDLPQFRDSMQADYLRLIAEAMLAAHTNQRFFGENSTAVSQDKFYSTLLSFIIAQLRKQDSLSLLSDAGHMHCTETEC